MGSLCRVRSSAQEDPQISVCRVVPSHARYIHGSCSRSRFRSVLGWDPIFEYQGKTYAEMDKEAKVRSRVSLSATSVCVVFR